jgi:hypothetical protein
VKIGLRADVKISGVAPCLLQSQFWRTKSGKIANGVLVYLGLRNCFSRWLLDDQVDQPVKELFDK